jgi:hypothetical protein
MHGWLAEWLAGGGGGGGGRRGSSQRRPYPSGRLHNLILWRLAGWLAGTLSLAPLVSGGQVQWC